MWLLALMIFLMPYEANPYLYLASNFLGIFPDFTTIKLLGLIGFAYAVMRVAAGGSPAAALLQTTTARLFLVFFVGVVFAGALSGTGFVSVSRYLAFLLFMPFVLASIETHRDLRRILLCMVLSFVLVFPYAVRQMIRFDNRLGVGLYETNYYAALLVLVIPLAFVFAYQQRTRGMRWLWMGMATLLVAQLYLTSSRGGFVGLMVASMVFVYRKKGAMGAFLVLLLMIVSIFVLPTDLGTRALATLFDDTEAPYGLESSNRAHVALFWAALRMIADNPIFGVGPLNFKSLSTLYTGLSEGNIAHNSFLEIAAEFGIPMLVVFVLLLLTTFRTLNAAAALRGSDRAVELAGWAEGLRSGLIGFCVSGLFISAQYEKLFWLTVFVTIALGRFARRYAREEVEEPAVSSDAPGFAPEPQTI